MRAKQLWLNLGLLAGLLLPQISSYDEKIHLFYSDAVKNSLGIPFGKVLLFLGTDPLTYFIGNYYHDADRSVLFIFSFIICLIIRVLFLVWILMDTIYWAFPKKAKPRGLNFMKKANYFFFGVFVLYALEWLVTSILSSTQIVPMFAHLTFGFYLFGLVGLAKVIFYIFDEEQVTVN